MKDEVSLRAENSDMSVQTWKHEYFQILKNLHQDGAALDKAVLFKYQHLPQSLYRYRRFDKEGNWSKNLANDTAWLSAPMEFNDPFDSSFCIIASSILVRMFENRDLLRSMLSHVNAGKHLAKDELESVLNTSNAFDSLLELTLQKDGTIPIAQKDELKKVLFDAVDSVSQEFLSKFTNSSRDTLRICCFCEVPNSILMWSHYSDYHKGFCIEYSTKDLIEDKMVLRLIHPVYYQETLFDAGEQLDFTKSPNLFVPLISACTKSKEWAYEGEWRFVAPFGIAKERLYRFAKPRRIIIGAKTPKDDQDKLMEIAVRKNIPLARISISPKHFALQIADF